MKKTTSNLFIFIFHWVKPQRYDIEVNEWNMLFWSLQKICLFLWISLSSVTIIVVVLFLNSLSTLTQRTSNENALDIFLWDRFCLSGVSLSRRHDIVDFSCCPLWRVLRVILVNLQNFGVEFHLRSLPSALVGIDVQSISWLLHYLLHRTVYAQQFLAFSLDSIMYSLSR